MKIIIQPYTLGLNNNKGKYYVFASTYDIIVDSDTIISKLIASLYNNRLFSINQENIKPKNTANGVVYTVRCEGNDTIDWVIKLLKWIKKYNKPDLEVQLNLNKSVLKSKNIVDFSSDTNKLNNKMQDMIVDSYIYSIYSIASSYKLEDILVSKVKKCDSNLRIDTSFDKLYIL